MHMHEYSKKYGDGHIDIEIVLHHVKKYEYVWVLYGNWVLHLRSAG